MEIHEVEALTAAPFFWVVSIEIACAEIIQLKGSGATPFSRNGAGRAALGLILRIHH